MTTTPTTPLYKRVGRKYVPVAAQWYEERDADRQAVGTFRLTYAYTDGGRMYEYNVTPSTAPMVAAMMVAKAAMVDTIREQSRLTPMGTLAKYTKSQLAAIDRFRQDMGGMHPTHWTQKSAYDIADAAMRAVVEYRP